MLRLRIARSLPWVDGKNNVRSPYEEFTLLDSSARAALDSGAVADAVVWEFGVLTDEWDAPDYSKPIPVGGEEGEGSAVTCFAVGSEAAPDYHDELRPLWGEFLDWLSAGGSSGRIFVADEIWHPEGKWIEIGPALQEGALGSVRLLVSETAQPRIYTAALDAQQLKRLIDVWWPSAVGALMGVVLRDAHTIDVDQRIAQAATITGADLPFVSHLFRTSDAGFDNLGFVVLSRGRSWHEIQTALESKGWIDGKPLDLILRPAE